MPQSRSEESILLRKGSSSNTVDVCDNCRGGGFDAGVVWSEAETGSTAPMVSGLRQKQSVAPRWCLV